MAADVIGLPHPTVRVVGTAAEGSASDEADDRASACERGQE
jgi:hypothetical protein